MEKSHNYHVLDQPLVLERLFHPRKEMPGRRSKKGRDDVMIEVDRGVEIAGSFYFKSSHAPVILFFHGNGEIVSDYDDLAEYFTDRGLNFFVVEFRGYGRSSGQPSVTSMMKDCHKILDYLISYMKNREIKGRLCIMGRSLGSASAIELGVNSHHDIHCLIIESGFAFVSPLLRILGLDPETIGYRECPDFENLDKIKNFSKPCLVIHAQFDHIIPFSDGIALYEACHSSNKFLLEIKNANHNDIFSHGMNAYLEHVKKICIT